ncbi:preprotein translocase subunit SecE [Candidatus Peregrinibacteria bacterium]|nr:preprotein translocase subunit SecE [Candidatus Peregrinibacteria bacterium]MBI3816821.1 preprotein translocase subunit SecE [Candidatus Peregrinibacteria bacterium]
MNRIVVYIREAIEELHHVRWPTRRQAMRLSAIVLGFSAACSISFGLIDFALASLTRLLLSLL